jgi:hypothetical protein
MRIAEGVANHYIPGLIPERKATKIDSKILDTYTGQYQTNPSVVLTLTREGDNLMAQQGTNPVKRAMLPESETNFFISETPRITYSFVKDEKGQITHMVVQSDGREIGRAKKIK